MKIKTDENLPEETAKLLCDAGHDAATVRGQGLAGAPDETVLACCVREDRSLFSLDTDFANILAYPPAESKGIVVFRLQRLDKAAVLESVRALLPLLERENPAGRLWIVEEDQVRIRQ